MADTPRGKVLDDASTRGALPSIPKAQPSARLAPDQLATQGIDGETIVGYCLRGFHEDESPHTLFCQKVERNYRAWRGILERRSDAAGWTNKQHPALIYQTIDTMLAGLLDPSPTWKLRARPRIVGQGEVPNVEQMKAGVKANELLLNDQLAVDCYGEKQTVYLHQNLIAGLTVAKNFWRTDTGPATSSKIESVPIHEPLSGKIIAFQPKMVQKDQGQETYFDGPTFQPIDVRDFVWHQAATTIDTAIRVAHRVWKDFGELKELERQGIYKNVDDLIDSRDMTDPLKTREQDLFQTDRTKDKIEVLECWIDHGRRVVSIGNRKVLLRDTGNPFKFEHLPNRYPFVVCSTTPDLFRIPGVAEVEIIREVQEILWTLLNQRLDNLQLINNAIVLLREDMDDVDSFDFYPGARNLVADPQQVQMWTPNVNIANLSLEAENIARGDLQNLVGASAAMQGIQGNEGGGNTATEYSLITTLAQRRLAMKKQNTSWAARRTGEQWMAMNQQMISQDKYVPVVGKDGELAIKTISPLVIQGRYVIDVDQLDESMMKQERMAQAQARLQVAVQAAPVFAAMGKPLNLPAFMDDYLDASDISDTDSYFSAEPPPQQPLAPPNQGQPSGQGPPMPTPGDPQGITASTAADANSPSNAFTQSPVADQARALASQGGAVNVGQQGR